MSRAEIQEKAEWFVGHVCSEDEEERQRAWEVGQELYEQFLPLIKSSLFSSRNKMNVEQSVWSSTIDREGHEDMLSEGKVQFFEALYEYDPSSGVYFVHYIKNKIQYGIFNYLRNGSSFDNALQSKDSLDDILSTDPEDGVGGNGAWKLYCRLMQEQPDQLETELFNEHRYSATNNAIRVAWNGLNQRQKRVLDLLIHKNYTLREAGRELGIHFTTVRGIKNNALKKMEKVIKKVYQTPEKTLHP